MDHTVHTSYLSAVMNRRRLKETVRDMCELAHVVASTCEFEALAFTGMSGASVAFPMSVRLDVPTIMVRKEDGSHHVRDSKYQGALQYLEGTVDAPSYVIVDDQISSGKTVLTIMARIAAHNPSARCAAIMLYNGCYDNEFTHRPWMDDTLVRAGLTPFINGFPPVRVYCIEDLL